MDKGKNKTVTRKASIHPAAAVPEAATPEGGAAPAAKKAPAVPLPPTGIKGESHAWQSALLFFGIMGALVVALVWGGLEFWSRTHGH